MIDTISISGACEATGFSERQLRSYEKTGLYQTAHQDHQRCIKIPPIFCGTYPLYQTVQKISGSGLHVAYGLSQGIRGSGEGGIIMSKLANKKMPAV